MPELLKFGKGNAKLGKQVHTFSLPAGHSCPGAKDCLAWVVSQPFGKRKLVDGKHQKFRCFAASQEATYTATYEARRHNFRLLKACSTSAEMADLILASLPKRASKVRIHVSGDYFSKRYLRAWVMVAKAKPDVIFYSYSKSLPWIVELRDSFPPNFSVVASEGGKHDRLIPVHGLKYARVYSDPLGPARDGLEVDHDDSLAADTSAPSFALLLHGVQPKGKTQAITSYSNA